MVLRFFDKVAYKVFSLSKKLHKNLFGRGQFEEDAKIQTLFVISLFQCLNIFFVLVNSLLFLLNKSHTPKYVVIGGMIVLGIFNYLRYYRGDFLEDMDQSKALFFNSNILTNLIIISYFVLTVVLLKVIGDVINAN